MMASEHAITFGSEGPLVGILGLPNRRRQAGVVVANSGIVHRIGANRQSVELCRRLGGAGFTTLRFDMSGLGDSPDRPDRMSWERSAPAEIGSALDRILHGPVAEAVLFGHCGGAAKSFWAAERDSRVRGLVLANPPPHPGRPSDDTAERLARLLARGVLILLVYAAGDPGLRFYEDALAAPLATCRVAGTLSVALIERANHTFATAPAKAALLDTVADWMHQRFPAFSD